MHRRPRVLAVLAPLSAAALLSVLACVGCGGRPSTPEELFATLADLNEKGETGKMWDLYTDEARNREMAKIDGYREVLRKNPGRDKLWTQFNVEKPEDILTLSYVELYRRENEPYHRALVGWKIIDKQQDPRHPDEVVVTAKVPKNRVHMRAKQVGSGWGLVEFIVQPDDAPGSVGQNR
jgi:hypothetical protein